MRERESDPQVKPVGERTSGRANPPLRAFTPGDANRRKLRKIEDRLAPDALDEKSLLLLQEIYESLDKL